MKALTSGSGLNGIYSEILAFFPKQCSLLLELTHPLPPAIAAVGGSGSSLQPPRVPGFCFLVNAVWPEVVAVVEERISTIFAPGNPDTFHKVCVCVCVCYLRWVVHLFSMHKCLCFSLSLSLSHTHTHTHTHIHTHTHTHTHSLTLQNYTTTMEFISSFEALCPTQTSVRRLRAHPSFTLFLSKFSVPVYFQIRSLPFITSPPTLLCIVDEM